MTECGLSEYIALRLSSRSRAAAAELITKTGVLNIRKKIMSPSAVELATTPQCKYLERSYHTSSPIARTTSLGTLEPSVECFPEQEMDEGQVADGVDETAVATVVHSRRG